MAKKLLFATWEGGGHVAPLLDVARLCAAASHDVLILSDEANRRAAESRGLPFRSWRRAPNRDRLGGDDLGDWRAPDPAAMISLLCRKVLCGPAEAYARDLVEALEAFPADVIVANEMLFGAALAAEAAGRPFAVLTANLWPFPTRPDTPPFGPGLSPPTDESERARDTAIRAALLSLYDAELAPLNAARAAFGLAPLDRLFDQLRGAQAIVLGVARAFDFGDDPPPPTFSYAGPVLRDPDWSASAPEIAPDLPLVVVSSSTFHQGQRDMMQAAITAMSELPVQAIATLGPALDPSDFADAPRNVRVLASASHDTLVPRAAALVSHGGHGTIARALMAGVPCVTLPMGRDQPENAARIAARGAGLTLPPTSAPGEIAAAVREAIERESYRKAAARLGAAMRAEADGGARAARLLGAL